MRIRAVCRGRYPGAWWGGGQVGTRGTGSHGAIVQGQGAGDRQGLGDQEPGGWSCGRYTENRYCSGQGAIRLAPCWRSRAMLSGRSGGWKI